MPLQIPTPLGSQLTGARAVFSLNGKYFAWGAGVDYGHSYNHEEYRTLNAYESVEHVPVAYGASFSCAQFSLIDRNLTTFGVQAQMGNNAQQHLLSIIGMGELNASVEDALDSKLLAQVYGLKLAGSSFTIQPNSLVMGQVSFVCRRIVEFGN